MKQIWTGRIVQAGAKYGEQAPMAAVCCNACRTCVTTNALSVVFAAVGGAGYARANFARRRYANLS
jgi:hypothetical protein